MPQYFFHTNEGVRITTDETGIELANAAEARKSAIVALTELGSDVLPDDGDHKDLAIRVVDENGVQLFEVSLKFNVDRTGA